MNNSIKTAIIIVATIAASSPLLAAEQVTINGQTGIYCSWPSAAAAMRKAAKAGSVTIKDWKKFAKGSAEYNDCKAKSDAKKAAKAKAKAKALKAN